LLPLLLLEERRRRFFCFATFSELDELDRLDELSSSLLLDSSRGLFGGGRTAFSFGSLTVFLEAAPFAAGRFAARAARIAASLEPLTKSNA